MDNDSPNGGNPKDRFRIVPPSQEDGENDKNRPSDDNLTTGEFPSHIMETPEGPLHFKSILDLKARIMNAIRNTPLELKTEAPEKPENKILPFQPKDNNDSSK